MTTSGKTATVLERVLDFNRDRKPKRVRLKLQRMRENAFAFFRGTDHLYADSWPSLKPSDPGPAILLCGDLHLENFGAYRADDGEFRYDINDFDEALIAPCSVDLVRCTTSILLAADLWRLSPLQATGMALVFLDHYRTAVTAPAATDPGNAAAPHTGRGPVWDLLGKTAVGSQVKLLDHATERTRGGSRKIVRSAEKRPSIRKASAQRVRHAVEHYGQSTARPEEYRVLDVTSRIAGIGSLGVRRYIALIEGGGSPDENRLLDIKEARPSSLRACTDVPQPETGGNEALRIVHAQRTLQARPTAGLDVLTIGSRGYRMRELVPDENRSSLDRFQKRPDKLRTAIEEAGQLTGWSHLRGCHCEGSTDRVPALVQWAQGPSPDSLLAAAVRYAERTRLDYEEFLKDLATPAGLPKTLRPAV